MSYFVKQQLIGILVGLLVPVITFFIFYKSTYSFVGFGEYIEILMARSMISKVMALAAIPNLLVFYLFLMLKRDYIARGIVIATLVFAVFVGILYFVY